jgi:hypothetical protein
MTCLVALMFGALDGVAVGGGVVGVVGRGEPDVAAQHHQRRAVVDGHGPADGRLERIEVVGDLADVLDVPAVALEALDRVVVERQLGGTVDGDVVVVVDVDERPRRRWPASDAASWLMPSSRQPSPQITKVWWSTTSGLNRSRSQRSARPMPTPLAKPWPSGPVVTSTPLVWCTSGGPAWGCPTGGTP